MRRQQREPWQRRWSGEAIRCIGDRGLTLFVKRSCSCHPYQSSAATTERQCAQLFGFTAMALTYSIDIDTRLITITGEYADAEEWAELLGRMVSDPQLAPGFAVLRDLRNATK